MARQEINRSAELEVFVRVVDAGNFSAAARALDMTPSAVSKLVARLEVRLGTRLLVRSSRQLRLTTEGCVFYERGVRILADLDDAECSAAASSVPKGRLRVNVNVPYGQHLLLPMVPAFYTRYPQVQLDIVLADEVMDLYEHRTDVAVRAGPMRDSGLIARHLGSTAKVIVGAPRYFEERGLVQTPGELAGHLLLDVNYRRADSGWRLQDGTSEETVIYPGNHLRVSNGEALRQLVLAGAGLARLSRFQVENDIRTGRLLPVLEPWNPGDQETFYAVYVGQGALMPQRIRVFLDFLAEHVRLPETPSGFE
ncbi:MULTISPECIES: LysR family transcriptional regulator [Oceanospirillaceae]|uniref:LysR family transcriptional regulator n=1 Tax=Oceanobacter antarcticus TaxID=3133425 RepID=A0ABW8NJC4_9GAMM|tara:strand:+ start:1423 stop:2352 length:930 start_codon:yes stop_codon:yes gene_type:complete